MSGDGVVKVFQQFLRRADGRGYDLGARRVGALWTGIGPTLMRDVPFSIVYFSLYGSFRRKLLDEKGVL